MKRINTITSMLIAATFFAACGAPADNKPAANNANTNPANVAAKPVAAAPTKEALMTLERSAYEAWKTKDAKFWETFLSDKFVGYGQGGKLDKASASKEYTGSECDVKSYALSDDQMKSLGNDSAMITYKVTVDATCGGKKLPPASWAAGVYVRDGEKWKGAFHAEAPVVDPKAAPAKPAASTSAKKDETKPMETKPDAATEALFAVEKKAWEDWKDKNAKGLDEFAAKDMVSLSGTDGWTDRETSLKRWTTEPCEIKTVSIEDPASTAFGSDYALLTFKSVVDGKCGGQALGSEWGATIYVKENGTWKALMTMGTPAS